MAERTERFEGKTPDEIKAALARLLQETLERDVQATGTPDLQQWWKAEDAKERRILRVMHQAPPPPQEL
jgi:hypothetical protein